MAVSDRSVKFEVGTSAWSLWNNKEEHVSSQLPSDGQTIDYHRAQLSGSISFFTFVHILKEEHKYKDNYDYMCNNEGVINILHSKNRFTSPDSFNKKH